MKDFGEKEFTVFLSDKKSGLVLFSASWCGACQVVTPIIEKLEKKHPKINFVKIDVSKSPELASKYGVMSIPNLIFFKNGKIVDQLIGAAGVDDIEKRITKLD